MFNIQMLHPARRKVLNPHLFLEFPDARSHKSREKKPGFWEFFCCGKVGS
ncbi:MAG: hypothetical protein ACRC62_10570 [Microcoleus sp.]